MDEHNRLFFSHSVVIGQSYGLKLKTSIVDPDLSACNHHSVFIVH